MRESFPIKATAALLSVSAALGLTACSTPFNRPDPNQLTACSDEWTIQNLDLNNANMSQAMAALEAGRSDLVTDIENTIGNSDNQIQVSEVPPKYQVAANLLIGKINEYWYDTSKHKLSTPRDEFCKDAITSSFGVYKSPAYVNATAALEAAGIKVNE